MATKRKEKNVVMIDPPGAGFLNREQACQMLGIHMSTLIRWEDARKVIATIGPAGHHLFDKQQLEELRNQRTPSKPKLGQTSIIDTGTAIEVFKCFEQHMVPNQVVTSAGVHPDLVERLREQWDRMRAKDRLLAEYSDQIKRQGEALQQLTSDIGKRLTSMIDTVGNLAERVRRLENVQRAENQQPPLPAISPRSSRKPEPEDNTEELLRHIAAAKALMAASEAEEAALTAGTTETSETAGAGAGAGASPTPA